MPYIRIEKCVFKKNKSGQKGEKVGCSKSVDKAKKYLKALYASTDETLQEIKDYFSNKADEDYLSFDDPALASIESLMDPNSPAPWDSEDN